MNKKQLIVSFLLVVSPFASALDFGDLVSDVVKNGNISTKNILGALKSITKVTTGEILGNPPKGGDGSVVLYSTTWCGYCTKAINYMDSKNIPYVNKDIESGSDNKAEYKELGGTGGVPFIVFGDKVMKGFSPSGFDKHYAAFEKEYSVKKAADKQAVLKSGDMLKGKIAGVQVYKKPDKSSPKLIKIGKEDDVIYMGEEQSGYFLVTTSKGEGWVDKVLVKK
jgi:glutaredoxin